MNETIYVAADVEWPVSGATAANGYFRHMLYNLLRSFLLPAQPDADPRKVELILDYASAPVVAGCQEVREYIDYGVAGNSAIAKDVYRGPNSFFHLPSRLYGFPVRITPGYDCTLMLAHPHGPFVESPVI